MFPARSLNVPCTFPECSLNVATHSLGVVELTVALHSVFDLPEDKVLWDVGHQSYPHKILTGRRENMKTLRMTNGLTPFTKRAESEYDPFGAGHSSTSISAGVKQPIRYVKQPIRFVKQPIRYVKHIRRSIMT
jgi:hypothetical protein